MRECSTHHHACACREARMEKMEKLLAAWLHGYDAEKAEQPIDWDNFEDAVRRVLGL